ncbi:MAG: energy transducer TonB, partial [Lutibacter sp.]
MMKFATIYLFSIVMIFSSITLLAQEPDSSISHCDQVVRAINSVQSVENFPNIKGGDKQLDKLLIYADSTERNKYNGTVYLGFWVNADGKKDCIQILKGMDRYTNQEALRIISKLEFNPGSINGQPAS